MHTIASSERGGRGKPWCRILAVAMALAPAALSQGMGGGMGAGMGAGMGSGLFGEPGENGFGFYGVAAYAGYTSTPVPFNAVFPVVNSDLGANYLAGGSASMGYMDMGARTVARVAYTISYDASLRYSSWNSLNHYLSFGVSHEVTPRLTYHLSGKAAVMRWDQFLFEPTVLSEVASAPSTFDELVSAIMSGKYTNSQLASILTGAPILDSPAATLLYGTRFFTSSLRTGLAYDLSPRLHFHADVGGSRAQHLATNSPQADGAFLVPDTTTASASTGVEYSVNPLTTIGFTAQASRTFSRFEDAYISSGTVNANRVFGRHWLVNGRAGAGTYVPVRQTFAYKPGPRYVAGGGITYKASTQTVMLQFAHTIEDTSGIGAESANNASGVWTLHRPGQRWALFSQARYSQLRGSTLSNINAWLAGAGIERMLNRHTNVTLGYIYGRNSGLVQGVLENQPFQAAHLVISWTPHPMGY